jgi:hypothetical protein
MPSGSHEDEASGSTESDGRLRAFRERLHASCGRRADALFELTDAVLTSGPVHSLLHLSLAVAHRRGWCSLYATLSKGRVDLKRSQECCRATFQMAAQRRFMPWTSHPSRVVAPRAAPDAATSTTRLATRRASPSLPDGLTSSWPS